jgi:hypothetical protein
MASENDQEVSESSESAEERRARRERSLKKKKAKPPVPTDEREIDAPDKLTLSMLGVMAIVTITLWIFARGACNYHPPRETRRPRPVKLEELARDPKGAAIEMQQRFAHLNFDGALELAVGDAANEVKQAKSDCMQKPQDCAMKKKQLEKGVDSTAALLERSGTEATVRVTTQKAGGPKDVKLMRLERQGPIWKVTSRAPDDPNFKPRPPDQPTLQMLAAPPPTSLPPKPREEDE